MLVGYPTKNGTGISIFGDYADLKMMYQCVHRIAECVDVKATWQDHHRDSRIEVNNTIEAPVGNKIQRKEVDDLVNVVHNVKSKNFCSGKRRNVDCNSFMCNNRISVNTVVN